LSDYLQASCERRDGTTCHRTTGRPLRVLIAMHTFGHPSDVEALVDVCERFGLVLVEDAAQSLGSFYRGRHLGGFGKVSALSFNGNKVITTGGGGALLTNDSQLAATAKHLTTTAKLPHRWNFEHDQVGFNYRLPNINAALGCAQLEALPEMLAAKRTLAERYHEAFAGLAGVETLMEPAFARSNYWLNALLLHDNATMTERDALLQAMHQSGILTRPAWKLLSDLPMYADCPSMDLSTARQLERRIINLPSSVALVLGRPTEDEAAIKLDEGTIPAIQRLAG
jgi:perosamine synthetase